MEADPTKIKISLDHLEETKFLKFLDCSLAIFSEQNKSPCFILFVLYCPNSLKLWMVWLQAVLKIFLFAGELCPEEGAVATRLGFVL